MSRHWVFHLVPPPAAAPLEAAWHGGALTWVQGMLRDAPGRASRALARGRSAGRAVWHGLEVVGERRAARELRNLADLWQFTRPELAQQLRDAIRRDA